MKGKSQLVPAVCALLFTLMLCGEALAGDPVIVTSSSWATAGKLSGKVEGQRVRGAGWGDLHFGPSASPALAANEFRLDIDDGFDTIFVRGTYSLDTKQRPVLVVNTSALASELESLFPIAVTVQIDKVKLKVRPKSSRSRGESMKVQFSTRFTTFYQGNSARASLKYKGTGGRTTFRESRDGEGRRAQAVWPGIRSAIDALVLEFTRMARIRR